MKRLLALFFLAALPTLAQTYGKDGSDTALTPSTLPAYATVSLQNVQTWTWPSGVTCWWNPVSFTVTINVTDGSSLHVATLYELDGDSTARAEMINSTAISNFSKGAYQSFPLKAGANVFTFTRTAGANAVLTMIYFDTTIPVTPASACTPTKAYLFWSPIANATSYAVLRSTTNGGPYAQVGTSATPSYVDSTISAGVTYYYVTTATNAQGTSGDSVQITVAVPLTD